MVAHFQTTTENLKLLRLVKDEIVSFTRYNEGQLIALDRNHKSKFRTWNAKEKFSYIQWVDLVNSFTAVKVEGLEDNQFLMRCFKKLNIKDIHLFHSFRTDYSFGWHHDTIDVYLYVLKGKKRINIKNKTLTLYSGQGIFIPKGYKHKVFNYKNTWALSLGLK